MRLPIRISTISVAAILLLLMIWQIFTPRYPRAALPSTAKEIHDYDTSGFIGMQSDYFYLLTAEINETEFEIFIQTVGFVESEIDVDWLPEVNGFVWWKPSNKSKRIYESTSRWNPNAVAKYENGRLYYKEWSGY